METLALSLGVALPWVLGFAALASIGWPRAEPAGTALALRIGFGYLVGAVLITMWMRGLSMLGIAFGWMSIGIPLIAVAAGLLFYALRSQRLSLVDTRRALVSAVSPTLPSTQRIVWIALLAWLALRFGLLAAEVAWRPLYPWDAWIQWATKARVWYELGRIVPFVRGDEWLAGAGGAYFDASPNYPATVPLLQVWTCVALGRWDDSAMNWPWLAMLVSLTVAVYGVLRGEGVAPLIALLGAYFIASLPLLDVHVALAGYADLPMAAVYTLAALATYRWCLRRDAADGVVALFLALACPLIKNPGWIWALTLVPGVVIALMPRRGVRVVVIGFGLTALIALLLARTEPVVQGYHLHLEFAAGWAQLIKAYFLMGNWNLLFYGVIVVFALGARRLLERPLVALAAIATAGLGFLFFVFAFTQAGYWLADLTTANRATLHLAPLLVTLAVLTWHRLALRTGSLGEGSAAARTV
ncbi:MAG TPA: hypothetical protein VKG21_14115 [Casimicrobiaceae bacterium]|nr:hypothetical protein [Casimicrobiaceae bacterium]